MHLWMQNIVPVPVPIRHIGHSTYSFCCLQEVNQIQNELDINNGLVVWGPTARCGGYPDGVRHWSAPPPFAAQYACAQRDIFSCSSPLGCCVVYPALCPEYRESALSGFQEEISDSKASIRLRSFAEAARSWEKRWSVGAMTVAGMLLAIRLVQIHPTAAAARHFRWMKQILRYRWIGNHWTRKCSVWRSMIGRVSPTGRDDDSWAPHNWSLQQTLMHNRTSRRISKMLEKAIAYLETIPGECRLPPPMAPSCTQECPLTWIQHQNVERHPWKCQCWYPPTASDNVYYELLANPSCGSNRAAWHRSILWNTHNIHA